MWYKQNFEREKEVKQGVEGSIADIFGEKEWRIYDIWLNEASPNKGKKTSFLKDSLNKMTDNLNSMEGFNKDIKKISNTLLNIKVSKGSIVQIVT
jgi:hypothetical protein